MSRHAAVREGARLVRKSAEVVRLEPPPEEEADFEARSASVPEAGREPEASPLYGVAMLKIAMELKRRDHLCLDEILVGVLRKMNLPEAKFRAYLAENGGLLRAIAHRQKY